MPSVYQQARSFRAALLARDADALARMIDVYKPVQAAIARKADALVQAISAKRSAGKTVSVEWLYREERYRELTAQIESQIAGFAPQAAQRVRQNVTVAAAQGAADANQLVRAAVGGAWNRLPTAAIETMAGSLSPASPLTKLLETLAPQMTADTQAAAKTALLVGITAGQNPRMIAQNLADASATPIERALTISRTETFRAYRQATQEVYRAHGDVLDGWMWQAVLTSRSCRSCIAMSGTIHPLDEEFGSHPNCRCCAVPYAIGDIEAKRGITGEEWLQGQEEHVQAQILGRSGAAAWRGGEVELGDFVRVTQSEQWGMTRSAAGLGWARIGNGK